jgi:hypothetical protein
MSDFATEKLQAESTRQNSKANNNNAAGHKAADLAYYQSLLLSARKYSVPNCGARQMIIQLGGSPPGGSWLQGD